MDRSLPQSPPVLHPVLVLLRGQRPEECRPARRPGPFTEKRLHSARDRHAVRFLEVPS